ncbi:uncharacterized protein LOC125043601 [Penaeus chinensis]|uniref:uncharacterized protein LOC125043601 n=1 Tax=Penaeus chinensis TaxID=139456 RepID=UPI001FB71A3B|nr:uncharacterized protein LOC125043601 [Penaeus chinensis]
MRMLLALLSAAASLVPGALAVPGERSAVMGDLHWCSTLCLCHKGMEMQCFDRSQIYALLQINSHYAMKLERAEWLLEERVHWCNDLCLCHTGNNKEFQCIDESKLEEFIGESVDGALLYSTRPREEAAAVDEADQQEEAEADHRRRSEERKRKKQRKNKKRVREDEEEEEEALEDTAASSPPHEDAPAAHTTTPLPAAAQPSPAEPEGDAELLPKQEAVAASPAVTAMQPPSRRQPLPPTPPATHASHASTREGGSPVPEVSAVREVPVERKTVALEVSQDLDELGSAVMQIRSDVVLNQRILLVTVAVAGIAMLGVLILAVHSCARRRQMAAEEKQTRDQPKDDHHVTKINREEEW